MPEVNKQNLKGGDSLGQLRKYQPNEFKPIWNHQKDGITIIMDTDANKGGNTIKQTVKEYRKAKGKRKLRTELFSYHYPYPYL